MALNKLTLKAALKAAFVARLGPSTAQQDEAMDALSQDFADAIDAFVRSGEVTVTVQAGIHVTTPDTINGATIDTGTGTGSID